MKIKPTATATILICRDAQTGLTEAECKQKGIPYEEFADIEVEVEGLYHAGFAGRRVDGARFAEPDEEPYFEIAGAKILENNHKQISNIRRVFNFIAIVLWIRCGKTESFTFLKGDEIDLTDEEDREASEKMMEVL